MPNYTQAIEEIKSRCDIVDVIGQAVPLKRSGDTYKACCPFHHEKTPSFIVSEKKQFYHCFGCGESGDAFSFLQKYYNISFPQAVEKLAAQYGVTIEKEDSRDSRKRTEMLEVNRLAGKYYFDNIKKPNNKGYEYITGRGITPDTIKLFGLGYAEDGWDGLTNYLKEHKVSEETMLELGLCSKGQKGKVYDKYRSRLMFPIIDTRSKVIGFGGRIIGEGEPKYLNSSESLIFLKKNNLFGLNKAKDEISKEGYAFLVEGYMDMVSLYQAGVRNVVASLGTALTENQAKLLHRYCKKVILCYDADKAGINAALRGIDILRAAEMEVSVLHVEGAKDPDEFVKKNGPDAFRELARKRALSDVNYKVALIGRKYNINDTKESITFFKKVAEVLRTLSPVECEVYLKDISQRLKISEDALRREVMLQASKAKTPEKKAVEDTEDTIDVKKKVSSADMKLEQMILALSLRKSEYFKQFLAYESSFVTDIGMSIANILSSQYKEGIDFEIDKLKDFLDESELMYIRRVTSSIPIGDEKAAFNDCLKRLDKKKKDKRIRELELSIAMLDEIPDENNKNENFQRLVKELSELRKR